MKTFEDYRRANLQKANKATNEAHAKMRQIECDKMLVLSRKNKTMSQWDEMLFSLEKKARVK